MTILDANILLYAHNADAPQHARARRWLEDLLRGPETIGLPWPTVWALLRILTNSRLPGVLPPATAFELVRGLLAHPRVAPVGAGHNHAALLERMVVEGQAAGPRLTDAVLAAIAIEHGATLASTDRDFARFPGLRWINPLELEE